MKFGEVYRHKDGSCVMILAEKAPAHWPDYAEVVVAYRAPGSVLTGTSQIAYVIRRALTGENWPADVWTKLEDA